MDPYTTDVEIAERDGDHDQRQELARRLEQAIAQLDTLRTELREVALAVAAGP